MSVDRRRRLSVNRGIELNEVRRRGEDVDVHFVIGEREFPAHKLIVSLKSPFLKALISAPEGFKEFGSLIHLSSDISAQAFATLLDYIYSGEIFLSVENVFDILETATYLQLNDALTEFATEYLMDMIPSIENIEVFLQIWNTAERFNLSSLSSKLYAVLEYRLESLLDQNILSYLGLEELSRLLSNPRLCLRDEQRLWDALLPFFEEKDVDKDILLEFASILLRFFRFNLISWKSSSLPEFVVDRFNSGGSESVSLRGCRNCVYVFEYARADNSLTNIETFLEDKKFGPSFAYLSLNKDVPSLSVLPSLSNGKSYHQHYGPHSQINYSMMASSSSLLLLGGLVTHVSSKTLKSLSLTADIKSFELSSGTWLRWRSSIPFPCVNFGLVIVSGKIYLLGGLSDDLEALRGGKATVSYLNSTKLGVSRKVFVAEERDLTQMTNMCWKPLADMAFERRDFNCIHAQSKIFLIGQGFIDVYHLDSNSWSSLPPLQTHGRPLLALIGSFIYILSGKSSDGRLSNEFHALHTQSHSLTSLPKIPELRFDVIDAFAHNNLFYVFVKQRSIQTALFVYAPEKNSWSRLLANIPGTLRPGVLLRIPWLHKGFFTCSKPIKLESH